MKVTLLMTLGLIAALGCFGESRSSRLSPGLLFHELVHVAQDRHLGSEAYMESYVRGWAGHGFDYGSIPHEAQAYALTERYRSGGEPFAVRAEVERRFPAGDSR